MVRKLEEADENEAALSESYDLTDPNATRPPTEQSTKCACNKSNQEQSKNDEDPRGFHLEHVPASNAEHMMKCSCTNLCNIQCQDEESHQGVQRLLNDDRGSKEARNLNLKRCYCNFYDKVRAKQSEQDDVYDDDDRPARSFSWCHRHLTSKTQTIISLLVASILLNLLLVPLVVCLKLSSAEDAEWLKAMEQVSFEDSICLSCGQLGPEIKSNDTLFDVYTFHGRKVCCIKNSPLRKLLMLMLSEDRRSSTNHQAKAAAVRTSERRLAERTPLRWKNREAAAHVYLNTSRLPGEVKWEEEEGYGIAFTNSVRKVDGRLKVPSHGLYFIYSSMVFDFTVTPGTRTDPVTHVVSRRHEELPRTGTQTLLMEFVTMTPSDVQSQSQGQGRTTERKTSFICGVLKLRVGDEIWANASNPHIINKYFLSNYIGLYRILDL